MDIDTREYQHHCTLLRKPVQKLTHINVTETHNIKLPKDALCTDKFNWIHKLGTWLLSDIISEDKGATRLQF